MRGEGPACEGHSARTGSSSRSSARSSPHCRAPRVCGPASWQPRPRRRSDRLHDLSRYNGRMGNPRSAPAVAWQPSLWARQSTVVDVSYSCLERTHLDEASWVDHCPGWMSGSDRAFEDLLNDVAWSQRRRWMYDRQVDEPRLTSWQKIEDNNGVACLWLEDARSSRRRVTASGLIRSESTCTAMAPIASPGIATAFPARSSIPS